MQPLALCLLLFVPLLVIAAEPGAKPADPVPPPPPIEHRAPTAPGTGGGLEPEITITTRDGEIFEEYRYAGKLYRVKVTPRRGPPYYLIYDEHGNFHRSGAEPDILIPQWVIRRF